LKARSKKNAAIAWSLLLIILSVLMIKIVHHHGESEVVLPLATNSGECVITQSDDCPICQFVFSPTEEAAVYHLVFAVIFLGVQSCLFICEYRHKRYSIFRLRSPPFQIL